MKCIITTRCCTRRPAVRGASCYKLQSERAAATRSHAQAITMHCSALVQHGSFASIPPICRYSEREGEKKTFSSHRNILLETPITTCLARRPRAPRHRLLRAGACSATARESEISFRRWWPGRLLPSSLSLALPLCSLLPPFRAPSLPPTQPSAFCHRLSGDPQIPAHTHTHTQTWKCILLLRNYLHHPTL